jgi:hypothetical protein
MERDKDKNKTAPKNTSATREGTPALPLRGPFLRTELDVLICNQAGPVTDPKTARKWLENKSWLLVDEHYDRSKLVNMLLTVSVLSRIPPETAQAIRAIAYILDDDITDNFSSFLATSIADKIKTEVSSITNDLNISKTFLEASSVQQASNILDLKEAIAKSTETSNILSDTVAKVSSLSPPSAPLPPPLPPNPWNATASHPSSQSLPNPSYNPSATVSQTRLKQRLLQSARSVYVQSDPNGTLGDVQTLPDQDLQKLRNTLNQRLEELDAKTPPVPEVNPDNTQATPNKPKTLVRGIHMRKSGDFILELDSPAAAARFIDYANEHIFLLSDLSPDASIKARSYSLIFKFVPCAGEFDPSDPKCIRRIEDIHGLKTGSIKAASWLKRPDRRAPGQRVATLKVNCTDPQTANTLLSEGTSINGHLITVIKDIREPIRCNRCQEYGHIRANCKSKAVCAHCAKDDHESSNCLPNQPPQCRSCGPSSHH